MSLSLCLIEAVSVYGFNCVYECLCERVPVIIESVYLCGCVGVRKNIYIKCKRNKQTEKVNRGL